jgi:uncharacterized protein YeeX (DUF496 family)
MAKQFDSEVYFTWELEVYNAEEVAEMGEHANTLKQYLETETSPEDIEKIIKSYNKKNKTKFDCFEITQSEHSIKRFSI